MGCDDRFNEAKKVEFQARALLFQDFWHGRDLRERTPSKSLLRDPVEILLSVPRVRKALRNFSEPAAPPSSVQDDSECVPRFLSVFVGGVLICYSFLFI